MGCDICPTSIAKLVAQKLCCCYKGLRHKKLSYRWGAAKSPKKCLKAPSPTNFFAPAHAPWFTGHDGEA
jgi:hypothetical protein